MPTNFIPSFGKKSTNTLGHHSSDDLILRELVPLSHMAEKNSKWILQVDLPGVERKDIVVTVSRGNLVIKAELEEAYSVSNHGHVVRFEKLKKVISLPSHADIKKISAKFKNGILTITIPKVDSGKRIPIG